MLYWGIYREVRRSMDKNYFRIFSAAAALFIFALAGTVVAQGGPETSYLEYISPGKNFRCLQPAGWSVLESPEYSREVTKADGFDAYRGGFEDRVTISVRYYPKGNQLYENMEAYIKAHSRPVLVALPESSYGPVSDIDMKGAKAKTFTLTGVEFESHVFNQKLGVYVEPLHPRKFPYTEKFIVVPAKSGFVAFRCKSRPDMAAQYEGVFRKVIDSFSVLESAGEAAGAGDTQALYVVIPARF
jgi:hypothetical protein